MKKRNLIIILLIIVLLVAAYIMATKLTPKDSAAPAPTPTVAPVEFITVFEADYTSVSKIVFENDTPFTLIKSGEIWKIEGNSAEIVQSNAISVVYGASSLSAVTKVENSSDLSAFGLDKPKYAITVYHGDTSTKILLGNAVATGDSYYFKLNDANEVYVLPSYSAEVFFKTPSSLRDLLALSIHPDEVESIEIISPEETLKIVKNNEASGADEKSYASLYKWLVTSPFSQPASSEKITEKILSPINYVTAISVAEDNPSSLSKYNLKTTVKIKTTSASYTVKIGEADGSSYLYDEGKKIIYTVDSASVSFANLTAMDVIQRLIAFPNIANLQSVSVTSKTSSATLSRQENGNGTVSYSANNTAASEEGFKSMYQVIIGLTVDGVVTKSFSTSDAVLAILYTMEDGSQEKIEFFEYDEFNFAVMYNSNSTFYIKKTKITDLQNKLTQYLADPTKKVM